MAAKDIFCFLKEYSGSIAIYLILAMSIIEITPIKINPWSKIFSFIGKLLNKEILDKMAELQNEVSDLDKKMENLEYRFNEKSAVDSRARIIRFGDEVSHGINHSRDNFQMIMRDITQYDQFCKDHPEFINNMTRITSERIEEDYKERDRKGDFL